MKSTSIELVHGQGPVEHAVIWLHGLGASANDFPPIVAELGLSTSRAIRFIFPQASNRPVTINGGMVMPAWYDIKGMAIEDKQDALGMSESAGMLDGLIEAQISKGVPSANIIVAGFSQGGAVAYHSGLRNPNKLAGILALSTYLTFAENVESERSDANLTTPILVNHGSSDGVVPLEFGKASADTLSALGYQLTWVVYPMEHQVIMPQIKEIGIWINRLYAKGI